MRSLWVRREIDAPAVVLWNLLTGTEHWSTWGPTVREATVDGGEVTLGATGTVTTIVGVSLPFEITKFDAPRVWGFAPYLMVCRIALRRLDDLATIGCGD